MIRVRLVADTVDELDRAADAVGLVLDVTKASGPVPRRTRGVSMYLDVELPTRPAQPGSGGLSHVGQRPG